MSSPWESGQSFPRRAFTTGVPWVSRIWLLVGFVTVAWTASDSEAWLTVISVATWWAVGQLVLYDSFTDGWKAGKQAGYAEFDAGLSRISMIQCSTRRIWRRRMKWTLLLPVLRGRLRNSGSGRGECGSAIVE